MVRVLIAAAIAWPAVLGGALLARVHDEAPVVAGMVYLSASRICHQRPERTFHWDSTPWPVCGRCSGLYLGGALGAVVAATSLRRKRRASNMIAWLAVAAIPTAITAGLEWTGAAAVSSEARAVAAIPLGALVAFVIIRTAAGPSRAIE